MAAYHQVAALDACDIDAGRHLAAQHRAQLLEDRPVLVLAGHFVEVEPHVLERQKACGQQGQHAPQQALAPVGLGFFPAQLQRVVDHVDQRFLARRALGLGGKARLQALAGQRLDRLVIARRQMDVHFVVIPGAQAFCMDDVIVVAGMRLVETLGFGRRGTLVFEVQVQVGAQGRLGAITGGRLQVQWLLLQQYRGGLVMGWGVRVLVGGGAEQRIVILVADRLVAPRLQGLRGCGRARFLRLAAALQTGQFLVQVEFVQCLRGGGPILGFDRRAHDRGRLRRRRRHGLDQRCWRRRCSRLAAGLGAGLLEQLLRRIEHLQAMPAAHHAARYAQLVVSDAKAGLAMRALGDETVGHAAIRGAVQRLSLGPLSGGDH